MPVKWKAKGAFNPSVILGKVNEIRRVDEHRAVSFAGVELHEYMAVLQSMLVFPTAVEDVEWSALIWAVLGSPATEMTPGNFLLALNAELTRSLSVRLQRYFLLTSLSVRSDRLPSQVRIADTVIRFLPAEYPRRFRSRDSALHGLALPVAAPPTTYCKVIVETQAKSCAAAVNKAFKTLDLYRALWCLQSNPQMVFAFGRSSVSAINVVRLGSVHTLHNDDGSSSASAVWFEPGYSEARPFSFREPEKTHARNRLSLRLIRACNYGEQLAAALVRYVRALDQQDPNGAFLGLWGALESLTTPAIADYDKTVRRCAFLFKDSAYHAQVLEHLRTCRNSFVHSGSTFDGAQTHCYQLQFYFASLFWFHIGNARFFSSLEEANEFLDSPVSLMELKRRQRLLIKALKYVG